MSYDFRVHLIVPLPNVATANAEATKYDKGSAFDKTYGDVRLSPNGAEPASHTGCSTQLQKAERDQVATLGGTYTWQKMFEAPSTFDDALASMGLKRIAQVKA